VGKGVGTLHIADFDIVTPSNLNRQKFVKKSLYRNKAIELARILSTRGFLGTELVAHPCSFQELDLDEISPTFVVGAVDNQLPDTRLEICRACYGRDIAGVILGVDRNADRGYVFVQAPGEACWACVFKPDMAVDSSEGDNEQKQCPGEPACIDILEVVAGHALYAIDTLLMARKRDWNYRVVSLSKGQFSSATMVPPRKGCPVCGTQERQT
jgi:molybdopterin/thiamine biosynthesis adenylyltransferase